MIASPNVKINLGLSVLRRRADGYHDIETVFMPSDAFHDTLEIVSGDDGGCTSSGIFARYGSPSEDGSCAPVVRAVSDDGRLVITIARAAGVDWNPLKDLTAKAYFLLSEDFGLPPVKIYLEKNSPVGAGLGGGSADAAYALRMLDSMFGLGLGTDGLAEYAARICSDSAFFIYNRPMFGEGRGEILSDIDLDFSERYELRTVVPENISVSTAEAYGNIVPRMPERSIRDIVRLPVEEWKGLLVNDFETTVFKRYPELAAIKESLYESGAVYASMSGSGSALFGIYPK